MEVNLPLYLKDPATGKIVGEISMGGAEGDHVPSLWLTNGDILNVRNIQGGVVSNDPGDLNLDLGAGSTENPGTIVCNFDVGKAFEIFDGRKNRMMSARQAPDPTKNTIRHQARTYFHGGAYVPTSGGGWRKL